MRRLSVTAFAVVLIMSGRSPSPQASWALAGPKPLHIRSEGSQFHLELTPASYTRGLIRSAQTQYRDAVSFIVTPQQIEAVVEQEAVHLRVGGARMRLGPAEMRMLREAARLMKPERML